MPHQKAAEDKAISNDGQILITHGMGLGKTLTSINIADRLMREGKAKSVLAVVPASLRTNFSDNGVKKYTNDKVTVFGSLMEHSSHVYDKHVPKTPYYVVSYDMFRKDPDAYLARTGADTLIVDEMHNFRNPDTVNYQQMKRVRGKVKNFIGLTGTPLNNHPYDTVPLVDIVTNGNHNLGKNKKEFSARFIRKVPEIDMYGKRTGEDVETLVNKEYLKAELGKWNHHATSDDLKHNDVPKKLIQNIDVEMSPLQVEHYKFVMNRVPKSVRDQIRDGLPVSRKEAFHILPMLQQARNVMNGVHYLNKDISLEESAIRTPKIKKALDDIQQHMRETPDAQIVVHSHMLEGGCDVMSAGLKARGISHGLFTGKEKHEDREKAVKDYNAGKNKVLVISSAGTTGLNLPNTTMHVALDPHFNPAVIDQIEARGIRAGGQRNRNPEERRVLVRRYRSVNPPNWYQRLGIGRKDMSVDEWMYGLASNKQDLNNQVDELMKSAQYFYHGTPEKNIPSIKEKGLLGSKRGDNFDNPDKWEPAATNGAPDKTGVFLTKCKDYAKSYSINVGSSQKEVKPLIVDIKGAKKLPNATDEDGNKVNEYFKDGNIKPDDIIFPDDPEYKDIYKKLQKESSLFKSMLNSYKSVYNIE